jgi:hypothetical protein
MQREKPTSDDVLAALQWVVDNEAQWDRFGGEWRQIHCHIESETSLNPPRSVEKILALLSLDKRFIVGR